MRKGDKYISAINRSFVTGDLSWIVLHRLGSVGGKGVCIQEGGRPGLCARDRSVKEKRCDTRENVAVGRSVRGVVCALNEG